MERYGTLYPAQDIGELLRSADLTHVSNEIPCTPECPFPELYPSELIFCSDPKYIDLVEEIGTDVVELTGDHFSDYGPEANLYTLDLYNQRGWPYYGGGVDAQEAKQPLLVEINRNRIAFLGCNIGCQVKTEIPCSALATETQPGAAACDFEYLQDQIYQLSTQGYQVIATLQHKEYHTYTTQPDLVHDFGMLAEAGAAIVSGSQAHQPHGMAFGIGRSRPDAVSATNPSKPTRTANLSLSLTRTPI